jgi:O-antigen/teichoic acid export membrane protein
MINKLKPKSEFSRNVLTLMTGTTIAQAIPIAISPILTRIYTPEDFGLYALFISITLIIASIVSGRYELAIVLPKKDDDAINILALGFIITVCLSVFFLIIVILFDNYFITFFNNEKIVFWLYLSPITVFLIGLFNLLQYFNNRKKNYKNIANATIVKSIVLSVVQLLMGFMHLGISGLISGQIISQIFANIILLKKIINYKLFISKVKIMKIIALAKRYKDFPKFSMWAVLANTLSLNLINILISSLYSIATLGFYSLVQRVLGMPSTLIGRSIGQVFFQEATKEKQKMGKINKIFNETAKKMFFLGIVFFGVLFVIVEDLFAVVFGEEWRIAGEFAKIVLPLFFIRFIVAPFTFIPIIFDKIKVDLYFQIGLLMTYIIIFIIGYYKDLDFHSLLYVITFVVTIYYALYFLFLNNMKNGTKRI